MRTHLKIALVVGALALGVAPALALALPENQGTAHQGQGQGQGNSGPNYNPAPPNLPSQAKAYGRYCQGESKQHVAGQQGTPFSQCVKAMAQAAHHQGLTPREACKGLSKKHVKGQKRTPFAECVVAAAKLRHHEHEEGES